MRMYHVDFLAMMVYPLLSRVSKKAPLPTDVIAAAEGLSEFSSDTSIMDGLTALDLVESCILQARGNAGSEDVQLYVSRQRTLAFQLFERLLDDVYDIPGPGRVRLVAGLDRQWNHIDVARLFHG